MVSVSFIGRNNTFHSLWRALQQLAVMCPSRTFFHISKLKFRRMSIKFFHDNRSSPVVLAAVEFAMEIFD